MKIRIPRTIQWSMPPNQRAPRPALLFLAASLCIAPGCSRELKREPAVQHAAAPAPQPSTNPPTAAPAPQAPKVGGAPSAPPVPQSPPSSIEEGVRLVAGAEPLEPTTTFELRFDAPVVAPAAVGAPAETSPLRFAPPLKGSWTWLSSRSGVFVPEEPLRLGARYRLTLAPLQGPDGRPIPAQLAREVHAPGLAVLDKPAMPDDNAGANPEFNVHFNADVDPAAAIAFVRFADAAGRTAPADVQTVRSQCSAEMYFRFEPDKAPWQMRFPGAPPPSEPASLREPARGPVPIPSALRVRATAPLPPGRGWRLLLGKGLPAKETALALADDVALPVGDVLALAVQGTEPSSALGQKRQIRVKFNKSLGYGETAPLARFVSVEPNPENFEVERDFDILRIEGAFKLDTEYRVRVAAGLPAPDGTSLASDFTSAVRFAPMPPRLYFPDILSQQQTHATRQFDFLALNLPRVQVRAFRVAPKAATQVFAHFKERYLKPNDERQEQDFEFYRKVDLDAPPLGPLQKSGALKRVWQHVFDTAAPADETRRVTLKWDEILGRDKPGIVLVELEAQASGRRLGAQTLVQVTDLGAVLKRTGGQWNAWVFSNRTGQPVAGARIESAGTSAKAGPDGRATFNTDAAQDLLRLSRDSDTLAIEPSTTAGELPPYSFDIPVDYDASQRTEPPLRILLFSDRGVYQPGETVHLKGIVRASTPDGLALPAAKAANVRIVDPHDRALFDEELILSATGSFSVSVPLPKDLLGGCQIQVEVGKNSEWHYFQVARYEPDAFEADIAGARDFGPADSVALGLACRYYFGKPLAGAQVKWTVTGSDYPARPDGFQDFSFFDTDCHYQLRPEFQSSREEGEVALGPDGKTSLSVAAPLNAAQPVPRSFRALAEITDINQQTVSASAAFTRHSSGFYLGLRAADEAIRAGSAVPVEFVAVNADGTPREQPVEATARFHRVEWETRNVEGAGYAHVYQAKGRLVPAGQAKAAAGKVRRAAGRWQWVPDSGSKTSFKAETPGTYMLEVETTDPAGRRVRAARTFSVFGPGETDWAYRDAARIELEPDRESYGPGDTAAILVKSPIAGTALVTVEREKVMRSFVAKISRADASIRVPILPGDAPNVFVSVVLVRGADQSPRQAPTPEHRFGYCQLNVADPRNKLAVDVRPGQEDCLPGADVEVTATISGGDARPVEGAEVTLYAVDEGVLALMDYQTPDPVGFFYATRGLGVETWLTLLTLLPEDPAKRDYANKGYIIGDGGGLEEALRRNMLACAFWSAAMRTDAEGRVTARFKAPDSLTRYRIMAVAAADAGRFGSGQSAFRIRKPLMLQPSQPLFARVGDSIEVRGVLHNQTGRPGRFEIALTCDERAAAPEGAPPLQRVLDIPADGAAAADFQLRFLEPGASRWVWRAKAVDAEGASDAVETTIAVTHPVEPVRQICAIRASSGTTELLAFADPRALEGRGSLHFTIANSPLAELADAVGYLVHYPYGCIEQTASSLLPVLVLRDSADAIPGLKERAGELDRIARAGITRMLDMQTPSGGLSYWPGGASADLWSSAYGSVVLAFARRSGQQVPEGLVSQLHQYLREKLANTAALRGDAAIAPRCLAVWALALGSAPEPSYHEILFAKRADLSPENRALLALAIREAGGPADMARELAASAASGERVAGLCFDDPARDTALRLLACSRTERIDDATRLADELLALRRNGDWRTTQGNAWAVLALSEFARASGQSANAATGSIDRAGSPAAQFHLPASGAFTESEISLPWAGSPALRLHTAAQAPLYTRVVIESRPDRPAPARQDRGFAIERTYRKLLDDGTLAPTENLRLGDRILVSLRIHATRTAAYVAIEDPLPAILEAVNPEFRSREVAGSASAGSTLWFDHREMRGDKMVWFRDRLPAGQWHFGYLARVRNAGTATAPPARISEMYRPERIGATDATQLRATAVP